MTILSFVFFIASVCSMGYELLISRVFFELGFDETLSLTIPIGFYLAGMGLGTFTTKKGDHYKNLFRIEIILSISGVLFPFVIMGIHLFLNTFINIYDPTQFIHFEFYALQIFPLLIGFFSGKELQNFFYLFEEKTNRGYAFGLSLSYFGSLCAGLAIPILITSKVSPLFCSLGLSLLNLYILILISYRVNISFLYKQAAIALVSIISILAFRTGTKYEQFIITSLYSEYHSPEISISALKQFFTSYKMTENVKRLRTHYQVIDVIPEDFIYRSTNTRSPFTVYLNLKPQFDSESYHGYHQTMVIGSQNLSKNLLLKKILILGGGDGILLNEIIKRHTEVESIKQIELDEKMVEFAKTHSDVIRLNHHSFEYANLNLSFLDGITYLRHTKEKYDAIFVDFPLPTTLDLSKLFSIEFYKLCIKALNPDGYFVYDTPTINKNLDKTGVQIINNFKKLEATIQKTGCKNSVFFGPLESFGFCQPHKPKSTFDYEVLSKVNMDPSVYINMMEVPPPKLTHTEQESFINSIFKLQKFEVP